MVGSNRAELQSAIAKNDVESLCEVTNKLSTEKTLEDTVSALNKRQKAELWDCVLGMCMATLLDSNHDEIEGAEILAKMHKVLLCITRLASATLSSLEPAQREDSVQDLKVEVPSSLHETAVILHGILPTLKSERSGIKNTVCALFERWWTLGIPGKEELMGNTVLCLLDRSTQLDAAKADVARVMAIHQVLAAVDLSKESSAGLVSLLLQCCHHPQFISTPQGTQFLAFLLSLNQDLAQRLHETIKVHLPSVPGAWGSKYGEIYFRAWQRSTEEQKEYLELNCIQDLMTNACRMRMGGRGSLWYTLFKILNTFHGKKNQRGVLDMLTRLYGPILWRSLMVCNSEVRLSAAHIMFDVFPLQNSALDCEEADKHLQRQLDAMHNLLQDPVPAVRVAAVEGVGRVLSIYWELIPTEVIKCFMKILVEDLVYDVTSPAVREAVIKVMQQLCDNHLSLVFLAQILPSLGNFIHDTSERVRTAMLELLLKLKGVRAIKFYHVVPIEHLLARLEVDSSELVVRRVMRLLYKSFVPAQENPQQQLERCKALILSNPGAARQFFLHLPKFLDTEDSVKYMVVLCRFLVESARQLNRNNDSASVGQSTEDKDDCDDSGKTPGSSETPSRSIRSSAKKSKMAQGKAKSSGHEESNKNDVDEDDGNENVDPSQHQQLTVVLRGVTEAIYLMYITLSPMLTASEDFRPMSEGLAKKLSVTVREMMAVSQDPELYNTLVALAGNLPSRTIPMTNQSLINRLCRLKPGRPESAMDLTCSVKALVQWGKANTLVKMVQETLEGIHEDHQGSPKPKAGSKEDNKKKKKTVGFSAAVEEAASLSCDVAMQVIEVMLSQPECRPILLMRHGEALISLVRSLGTVTSRLKDALSPDGRHQSFFSLPESDIGSVALSVKIYLLHLRLCAFLSCRSLEHLDENRDGGRGNEGGASHSRDSVEEEANQALVTALTWSSVCLLPWLKSASEAAVKKDAVAASPKGRHGATKKGKKNESTELLVEKQKQTLLELLTFNLSVTSSVIMSCPIEYAFLDEAVQLCISLLQSLTSHGLTVINADVIRAVISCVYHLLSMRMKTEGEEKVAQVMSKIQQKLSDKETTTKDQSADIACFCLGLFFKSMTASLSPSVEDGDAFSPSEKSSDVSDSRGEPTSTQLQPSISGSDRADLLKSISPQVTELILELTRSGRPSSLAQRVMASALRCVIEEGERAWERDDLEEMKLPPLASIIIAAVRRRPSTLKLFCAEVETCLCGDEIFNMYQALTLLAVVDTLRSCEKSLQAPVMCQALKSVVKRAAEQPGMDVDVMKDLWSKAETVLKRIRSDMISDI